MLWRSGFLSNFQIVLDRESSEHLARLDSGDILVHFAGNCAVECQFAAVNDDTDGRGRIDRITAQHWIAIDLAQSTQTNLVVKLGNRRNFDVVNDVLDSGVLLTIARAESRSNSSRVAPSSVTTPFVTDAVT